MKTYNTMLDIAFTVTTSHKNWQKISVDEILVALKARVKYFADNPEELLEAVGFCDSYEITDD